MTKKHETIFEIGKKTDEDLERAFKSEEDLKNVLMGCHAVRDRVKARVLTIIDSVTREAGPVSREAAVVVSFLRDVLDAANEEVSSAEKALSIQTGSTLALTLQVDKLKKLYDEEVRTSRAEEAAAAYAPVLEAKVDRARAAAETLRDKKKKASQ